MRNKDVINVGFILSLVENNGKLSVEKFSISRPIEILKQLDIFEESINYDVFVVQQFASTLFIDKNGRYKYCWPNGYNTAFVQDAVFPKDLMQDEYDNELNNIKSKIELEYEVILKNTVERIELEYDKKKHPKHYVNDYRGFLLRLEIEKKNLIKEKQNELEEEKKNKTREKQEEYKKETYLTYIHDIRRYIYAQSYTNALPVIKEKALVYSNETIGWYKPDFRISGDVLVSFRTNFCYGRSAYFHVNVNYKGINILPYTDIVRYFWSNMMDNVRCTRDYYPSRNNWERSLNFIKEICDIIAQDNNTFEKKWIIGEVEKMMEGLKSVNDDIQKYYEGLKKAKESEEDNIRQLQLMGKAETPIIKYRHIDDKTIKRHKLYPHEVLLVIQVDKLSAALSLLEELSTLKNIYTPITDQIAIIIHYNERLVPAIDTMCGNLKTKIAELQQIEINLQSNLAKEQELLQIRKNEINALLEAKDEEYRSFPPENVDRRQKFYNACNADKEYLACELRIRDLMEKLYNTQQDIKERTDIKSHLEERKSYITERLKQWSAKPTIVIK